MTNIDERELTIVMSEIMTPDMVNFGGNIHGGHLMRFFDKVAYACAAQYAGSYVVTLSVDQIFFKEPIFVGDLVTCFASVNFVGKSSMEIGIRVEAKNLITHHIRHTNSCYFTMVALDENRKPKLLPSLVLKNSTQERRFAEARERKKYRQNYFQKISKK